MLELGGCSAGPVLSTAPGAGWGPLCPIEPASVRGAESPVLAVLWLSGALRVLRWWDGFARVQGSASPKDGAAGGSRGAELRGAREGMGGPPKSPCVPSGCVELGLVWALMPLGWETAAVPRGTSVPIDAVGPSATDCPLVWASVPIPLLIPVVGTGVRAMVDTVGLGLGVLCPAQGSPEEPSPVSTGTSGPGAPSAEPWGSEVPPWGLFQPLASCPCPAMSISSATSGAAPPPPVVVSISGGASMPSPACSGGDQCTGLLPPQRSPPGASAPLGSPEASQAGDRPGHR